LQLEVEELRHLAERYRRFYTTQQPHQTLGYRAPLEGIEKPRKGGSFL